MKMVGTVKRFTAWCLSAAVAAGLTVCGSAADIPTEITGISGDFGTGGYSVNGDAIRTYREIDDLGYMNGMRPGDEIFVPLTYKDFEWENDKYWPITLKTIDDLKLELLVDFNYGNNEIDYIEWGTQGSKTGIVIKFADEVPAVEPEDFDVDISILVDGIDYREKSSFKLKGNVANRSVSIGRTTRSVTLGVGRMATCYAQGDVTDFPLELGDGVTAYASILYGEKVYGSAVKQDRDGDKELRAEHSAIRDIYYLEYINLSGSTVSFQSSGGTLYVYDGSMNYLGTSDSKVPIKDKYILSAARLD